MNQQQLISSFKNKRMYKLLTRENPPLIASLIYKGLSLKDIYSKELGYNFCYKDRITLDGEIYMSRFEMDEEIKILKKVTENPAWLDKYFKGMESRINSIIKNTDKTQNKDLLREFSRRINLLLPMMAYLVSIQNLEIILTEDIKNILRKKISEKDVEKYLMVLSKPYKKDLRLQSEIEFIKLAEFYQKKNNKADLIKKEITKFIKKYGFITIKWAVGKPLSEKDVLTRIKLIKNPKEELKKIESKEKETNSSLKKIIKELKFNSKEMKIISAAQKSAYFRTYRGDIVDIWYYQNLDLISKLEKNLNLKEGELKYFAYWDILKRKIEKKDFNLLKEGKYIMAREDFITDRSMIPKLRAVFEKENEINVSFVKGITANRGYAKGIVKIIRSNREIEKIKQGEILVSPMTTPDLMPAIKKAAAIVTDEGGITCHAAIISRELNKPCIIGTKNATSVFKDGDLVEVDANKGIVKKI